MPNNDFLFLLSRLKQDQEISSCSSSVQSLPGWTKNPVPGLAIPGFLMELMELSYGTPSTYAML